jgi:hypothetical protein
VIVDPDGSEAFTTTVSVQSTVDRGGTVATRVPGADAVVPAGAVSPAGAPVSWAGVSEALVSASVYLIRSPSATIVAGPPPVSSPTVPR